MQSSLLFVLAHVCAVLDLAGSGAIVQTHFQSYENVSLFNNMVVQRQQLHVQVHRLIML